MRLLINLSDQKLGYALSSYLTKEGIDNKLESHADTDWGSANYGVMGCKIWVIDEDHFNDAKTIAEQFLADPTHKRYYNNPAPPKPSTPLTFKTVAAKAKATKPPVKIEPMGKLTSFLIILCTVIYFFSELSSPVLEKGIPANLPATPFVMPAIYKGMLFDYPFAFDIIDKIINAYGENALLTPADLPPEGQVLLQQFYNTPYWTGIYDAVLEAHQQGTPIQIKAPLFEKIRQGEVWRLLTPCLLHGNILHLLFNMLWLAVLGRQMENRLSLGKYAAFMIIVGVLSNTAQYLMGGANFLGISGILTGMLAFVWIRQRKAAWEGYRLEQGTLGFIAFFVLLMFAIQLAAFVAQFFYGMHFSPAIANTAHLSGALVGYLLGKTRFFSWTTP